MNYILEINWFYDWLETNSISDSSITLWHALMHVNNKTGWKTEFTVASSVLETKSGLSNSQFKRARNILTQNGRILWEKRTGNQSAKYTLISFAVQYEPQSVPQAVPQSVPITKLKETKLNKTSLLEKETKGKLKFSPPSLLEIESLILEKNYRTVSAESFFNFYESKNWYIGKNKMKDWKMALAGWESRNKEKLNQNQNNGKPNNGFTGTTKKPYEFSVDRVIETYTSDT